MATDQKTDSAIIDRMFDAGAHFGYSKARRHPSAVPYIFGAKNQALIIDLEKTQALLEEAKAFAEKLGSRRELILFVGGKEEAQRIVEQSASSIDMPYVAGRWIGGTLTNISEIKKRIQRLLDLREQREKGTLDKYTKKERLLISREIAKLEDRFGGVVQLKDKAPKALFVIDTRHEHIAVAEANEKGVPIIGLSNVDCDLTKVQYPIVANDATAASIKFFVNEIIDAYQKGLANAPAPQAEEKKGSKPSAA